ncbi:hypothetical protein FRC03_010893 [Tulasnella sp. 419]|nr:hypothetical protein FRC03_010893 [Tulasnella sp. 419]
MASGVAYGMVELIRRIIPRDIVGGHVGKLKRMDATVHIFYEVAGTAGAFASAALITRLGNNYAFIVTPIFFTLAAISWSFISALDFKKETKVEGQQNSNYFVQVGHGFLHFGQAVWVGAKIIVSKRRYIWLVPGYSFALYGHRYLENGLGPAFSKRVLGVSTYSQIIVGGSNFGELLGAVTVFLTANRIHTPIPFIRLDALMLLIVWYLGWYYPPAKDVSYAWRIAATFIPVSFGWAAGDVSLAAYIQSSLARVESKVSNVSALGAVMSLLYVVYIVINAILSAVLGAYIDRQYTQTGDIHHALKMVGGVQFTVLCVIMIASTFIPPGGFAINPPLLDGEKLDEEIPVIQEPKGTSDTDSTDGKPSPSEKAHAERRSAEVEMFVPS